MHADALPGSAAKLETPPFPAASPSGEAAERPSVDSAANCPTFGLPPQPLPEDANFQSSPTLRSCISSFNVYVATLPASANSVAAAEGVASEEAIAEPFAASAGVSAQDAAAARAELSRHLARPLQHRLLANGAGEQQRLLKHLDRLQELLQKQEEEVAPFEDAGLDSAAESELQRREQRVLQEVLVGGLPQWTLGPSDFALAETDASLAGAAEAASALCARIDSAVGRQQQQQQQQNRRFFQQRGVASQGGSLRRVAAEGGGLFAQTASAASPAGRGSFGNRFSKRSAGGGASAKRNAALLSRNVQQQSPSPPRAVSASLEDSMTNAGASLTTTTTTTTNGFNSHPPLQQLHQQQLLAASAAALAPVKSASEDSSSRRADGLSLPSEAASSNSQQGTRVGNAAADDLRWSSRLSSKLGLSLSDCGKDSAAGDLLGEASTTARNGEKRGGWPPPLEDFVAAASDSLPVLDGALSFSAGRSGGFGCEAEDPLGQDLRWSSSQLDFRRRRPVFALPHSETFSEDLVSPPLSERPRLDADSSLQGVPSDAAAVFLEAQRTLLILLQDLHSCSCCCASLASAFACRCCQNNAGLLLKRSGSASVRAESGPVSSTATGGLSPRSPARRFPSPRSSLARASSSSGGTTTEFEESSSSVLTQRPCAKASLSGSTVESTSAPSSSGTSSLLRSSSSLDSATEGFGSERSDPPSGSLKSAEVSEEGAVLGGGAAETENASGGGVAVEEISSAREPSSFLCQGAVSSAFDDKQKDALASGSATRGKEAPGVGGSVVPEAERGREREGVDCAAPSSLPSEEAAPLHSLLRTHYAALCTASRFRDLLGYAHVFRKSLNERIRPSRLSPPGRLLLLRELCVLGERTADGAFLEESFAWFLSAPPPTSAPLTSGVSPSDLGLLGEAPVSYVPQRLPSNPSATEQPSASRSPVPGEALNALPEVAASAIGGGFSATAAAGAGSGWVKTEGERSRETSKSAMGFVASSSDGGGVLNEEAATAEAWDRAFSSERDEAAAPCATVLDPSFLLCLQTHAVTAQKAAVLRVLRLLRLVAPSWASREDNFGFHLRQVIGASAMEGVAAEFSCAADEADFLEVSDATLERYQLVLQPLACTDCACWSREAVSETLTDLNCLKTAVLRRRKLASAVAAFQASLEGRAPTKPSSAAVSGATLTDSLFETSVAEDPLLSSGASASEALGALAVGAVGNFAAEAALDGSGPGGAAASAVASSAGFTSGSFRGAAQRMGGAANGAAAKASSAAALGSLAAPHALAEDPSLQFAFSSATAPGAVAATPSSTGGVSSGRGSRGGGDCRRQRRGVSAASALAAAEAAAAAEEGGTPTSTSGGKKGTSSSDWAARQGYALRAAELPKIKGVFVGKKNTCWVAQWIDAHGQPRQSCFNIKEHGFDKARRMAVQARQEFMGHAPPSAGGGGKNNNVSQNAAIERTVGGSSTTAGGSARASNAAALRAAAFSVENTNASSAPVTPPMTNATPGAAASLALGSGGGGSCTDTAADASASFQKLWQQQTGSAASSARHSSLPPATAAATATATAAASVMPSSSSLSIFAPLPAGAAAAAVALLGEGGAAGVPQTPSFISTPTAVADNAAAAVEALKKALTESSTNPAAAATVGAGSVGCETLTSSSASASPAAAAASQLLASLSTAAGTPSQTPSALNPNQQQPPQPLSTQQSGAVAASAAPPPPPLIFGEEASVTPAAAAAAAVSLDALAGFSSLQRAGGGSAAAISTREDAETTARGLGGGCPGMPTTAAAESLSLQEQLALQQRLQQLLQEQLQEQLQQLEHLQRQLLQPTPNANGGERASSDGATSVLPPCADGRESGSAFSNNCTSTPLAAVPAAAELTTTQEEGGRPLSSQTALHFSQQQGMQQQQPHQTQGFPATAAPPAAAALAVGSAAESVVNFSLSSTEVSAGSEALPSPTGVAPSPSLGGIAAKCIDDGTSGRTPPLTQQQANAAAAAGDSAADALLSSLLHAAGCGVLPPTDAAVSAVPAPGVQTLQEATAVGALSTEQIAAGLAELGDLNRVAAAAGGGGEGFVKTEQDAQPDACVAAAGEGSGGVVSGEVREEGIAVPPAICPLKRRGAPTSSSAVCGVLGGRRPSKKSLASLARELPPVGGVSYNVKCSGWTVSSAKSEGAAPKFFTSKKYGGIEEAYAAAVDFARSAGAASVAGVAGDQSSTPVAGAASGSGNALEMASLMNPVDAEAPFAVAASLPSPLLADNASILAGGAAAAASSAVGGESKTAPSSLFAGVPSAAASDDAPGVWSAAASSPSPPVPSVTTHAGISALLGGTGAAAGEALTNCGAAASLFQAPQSTASSVGETPAGGDVAPALANPTAVLSLRPSEAALFGGEGV